MGREVRRVPKNWVHPIDEQTARYKPLLAGSFEAALREWNASNQDWIDGKFPSYVGEEYKSMSYSEYAGDQPKRCDYMPSWPDEEKTHLMMYEDTSEGTPISPAFETPEELAKWLVDNEASAFGHSTGTYEGWLRIAQGGWAPSLVVIDGHVITGVDA